MSSKTELGAAGAASLFPSGAPAPNCERSHRRNQKREGEQTPAQEMGEDKQERHCGRDGARSRRKDSGAGAQPGTGAAWRGSGRQRARRGTADPQCATGGRQSRPASSGLAPTALRWGTTTARGVALPGSKSVRKNKEGRTRISKITRREKSKSRNKQMEKRGSWDTKHPEGDCD